MKLRSWQRAKIALIVIAFGCFSTGATMVVVALAGGADFSFLEELLDFDSVAMGGFEEPSVPLAFALACIAALAVLLLCVQYFRFCNEFTMPAHWPSL